MLYDTALPQPENDNVRRMESGYGEEAHDGVLLSHLGVHVNREPLSEHHGPDQFHLQIPLMP